MNSFFMRQQFSNDKQTQADIKKYTTLQIFTLLYFQGKWELFKKNPNYKKET